MTKEEVFAFLNSNPGFFLATSENNQPHVRGMFLFKADAEGIVFHTSAIKDVCKQILANPLVELCFYDYQKNIQVRVTGKLEAVNDDKMKDEIVAHPSRKFLQAVIANMGKEIFYKSFFVFRLSKGTAYTWTFETNLAPKIPITL